MIAIAPDVIGAYSSDDPLVTADALAQLAAEPNILAQLVCGERTCLKRCGQLPHRRTGVRVLPAAFDTRCRPGRKTAFGNKRNAEAVVRRLEPEGIGTSGDIQIPQGSDLALACAHILGTQLRTQTNPHPEVVLVLRGSRAQRKHHRNRGDKITLHALSNGHRRTWL